jgi:acyl carrier protein
MNEESFLRSLAEFFHERNGLPESEITWDTNLVDSRILDSFGVIELFFHMERTLGRALDVEGFALDSVGTPRRIYEKYIVTNSHVGEVGET